MQILILAGISFPILFVLDLAWMGLIGHDFYRAQLGSMLRLDVLWPAAIAFYVLYALALSYFVLVPSLALRSFSRAALSGALLGLCVYAACNLSNLATLTGWPLPLSLVDILWGAALTAATALATHFIGSKVLGY